MILVLLYVFVAGAVGGVVNALLTDNGFVLPKTETSDKITIIRPGFSGNILIGGVAALISWGLYGPLAAINIMAGKAAVGEKLSLTLSALAGAVLVGVGGARWLTNEVDKKFLRATASAAANSPASQSISRAISISSPAMAFRAMMGRPDDSKK
jgi:hypothetical protein